MGNNLIVLDRTARRELEQLLTDGNTAQKIAKRARIVLMTADGHGVVAIMREVGVSKTTVWRWQDYFAEAGVGGLIKGRSKPPGRKPLSAAMKLKVVEKTVKERPANATHWSVRSMAEEMGISHTSVQRIWAEHGLKPYLVRSFKISNDPDFVAKVEDIVGLYIDPPEKALVLSVDEKSQTQALDRTQPGLPLKKGPCRNDDHDCKRNGTTTLFAALDVAAGTVIGECLARHRADEFLSFLKNHRPPDARTSRSAPDPKQLRHPQDASRQALVGTTQTLHCTSRRHPVPGSTSLSGSSPKSLASASGEVTFNDVTELKTAIDDWIEHRNQNPKPFKWTASAKSILAKHRRAKKALAIAKVGCK